MVFATRLIRECCDGSRVVLGEFWRLLGEGVSAASRGVRFPGRGGGEGVDGVGAAQDGVGDVADRDTAWCATDFGPGVGVAVDGECGSACVDGPAEVGAAEAGVDLGWFACQGVDGGREMHEGDADLGVQGVEGLL
ncbi:hypothetical protein NBRGN_082_00330 [Nocardia brasiliensis NBRC 14402]|nr:hypothetical protein NBRGN_082_00330 [Nocardia brasiliensis NBRC 14402]